MFSKFDFRISVISMSFLFAVSIAVTVGLKYAALYNLVPLMGYLDPVKIGTADYIFGFVRALLIIFVAILPFRTHIEKRPVLFWSVWTVSLAGSLFPWVLLFIPGFQWLEFPAHIEVLIPPEHLEQSRVLILNYLARYAMAILVSSHVIALIIFWSLVYDEPETLPNDSKPA